MAYGCQDYHQDFPPVFFSTFKPLLQNREEPSSLATSDNTPTTLKQVAEPKAEAYTEKDKLESSEKSPRKDIMVKPGVKLKEQTYQWFERTQRKKLVKMGHFPQWFHGFLTRNRAEDILQDKPLGCFLVRFCESRVGFVLSYRGVERCRHFVLNQRDDEQYVIEGEDSAHPRLEDLINYYYEHPVEPYKERLTTPCSEVSRKPDSPNVSGSGPNSPTGPMYGRITKPRGETLNAVPALASSPKGQTKQLQDELQSSLLGWKRPPFPDSDLTPSQDVEEDPVVDYTPFSKPSESHDGDMDEGGMRGPTYASVDELHSYTGPSQWSTHAGGNTGTGHEPIAFYAIGRGSCRGNLDNVYSEVELHSTASCGTKAAKNFHSTTSTLPASKTSQAQKPSAFHSSFRSNKMPAHPQEHVAVARGKPVKNGSKQKTKQQIPVQFDDPAYGKNSSLRINASGPPPPMGEQENIYEKIPEEFHLKVKNIPPPKTS